MGESKFIKMSAHILLCSTNFYISPNLKLCTVIFKVQNGQID